MGPEQIVTTLDSKQHGCESCQWHNSTSNNGRQVCDASLDENVALQVMQTPIGGQ